MLFLPDISDSFPETLYQTAVSFHRKGISEKTDRAFDLLRKALDELSEMEHKEFGSPTERTEGKDGAALVAAQACEEESDSTREFWGVRTWRH